LPKKLNLGWKFPIWWQNWGSISIHYFLCL